MVTKMISQWKSMGKKLADLKGTNQSSRHRLHQESFLNRRDEDAWQRVDCFALTDPTLIMETLG